MTDGAINAAAGTFSSRGSELGRIGTFLNDFCTRQGVGREETQQLTPGVTARPRDGHTHCHGSPPRYSMSELCIEMNHHARRRRADPDR